LSGLVTVQAKGLLFDMDGVLVSSIASAIRCWRQWAAEYGVPNAEAVEIPHGVPARSIAQLLVPGVDVATALRRIEDLEIADVGDIVVLPGARSLLDSLPLERWAIVTSATRRLLVARLAAAKLPVPERLISADMVTQGKPDPEPFLLGAEVLGLPASDCIVFEDAPSGVRSGVAAGCRVVGVLGTTPAERLREVGASWVVESLKDVRAETVAGGLKLALEAI
jgi:mannitol-1-/sugar-/sorbitol-6-phosphatase